MQDWFNFQVEMEKVEMKSKEVGNESDQQNVKDEEMSKCFNFQVEMEKADMKSKDVGNERDQQNLKDGEMQECFNFQVEMEKVEMKSKEVGVSLFLPILGFSCFYLGSCIH